MAQHGSITNQLGFWACKLTQEKGRVLPVFEGQRPRIFGIGPALILDALVQQTRCVTDVRRDVRYARHMCTSKDLNMEFNIYADYTGVICVNIILAWGQMHIIYNICTYYI